MRRERERTREGESQEVGRVVLCSKTKTKRARGGFTSDEVTRVERD